MSGWKWIGANGGQRMKVAMLLLFMSISTAQAAEPTGTLTLACEGTMMSRSSSDTAPAQEQVFMNIIVNFMDRTVKAFGGDWSPPIPIHEVTETALMFADNRQTGLFEASVIGIIEFDTGDMEAVMKLSGKTGTLENFYSLQCKPTQRMF
jgi:hypothetical protein